MHSEYSIVDGLVRIDDIVKAAAKDGQAALAVTDLANLFCMVRFYKEARGKGVKPIAGCDLWITNDADREKPFRLLVLIKSRHGYLQLCEVLSQAWLSNQYKGRAEVRMEWLEALRHQDGGNGLIALSGAGMGDIGQAIDNGNLAQAEACARRWAEIFPGAFYLELQRAGQANMELQVRQSVALGAKLGLPCVATHPIQFQSPEEFIAHEARTCIAEGEIMANARRVRRFNEQQYFKSQAEMAELFADLPGAIANTVEVAKRCNLVLQLGKPQLPDFPTPDGMSIDDFLVAQTKAGLEVRLKELFPDEAEREKQRPRYEARLEFENNTIIKMKFPGYFLIVADFIQWAKNNGVPVGPGRGSGAGSLVAYCLLITDLDPLRYNLLFERFLNPERVSMPDFDIDFCQERREEVIRYVQKKYGREQVGQIITFGSLQARAALRDVGRVLEMSYGQVDKICKLVPNNPANPTPLSKAIEEEPKLQEAAAEEPVVARLLEIAQKIEGLYRHASTHAAGIVIGDRPLSKLVPMYRDPRSDMPVTQFNMKWVEQAGLVKFDFLGLKTLTVLKTAVDFVEEQRGIKVDLAAIPLDDTLTYEMLSRGETVGVFQVESAGMRKALIGMRPDCIEDIIALVALYRPGPMENIPVYNARKHGEEEVASIHPKIDYLLKETQGVIVYQEQVMQIAQVLSGYSLGEADLLRRAMGKKIKAEMDAQRSRFVDGCAKNDISADKANELFDLIDKFAGYGFNKSHAAAYALVAYHTAWLKAHHKAEFYAASMCYDMAQTDKLAIFIDDMRRMGVQCLGPCINHSEAEFSVEPHGEAHAVRYALGALKGVGEKAMEQLVDERKAKGAFRSLEDFADRIDPRLLNRRQLESLAAGGAFDALESERAGVFASAELILAHASSAAQQRESGQGGLFGDLDDGGIPPIRIDRGLSWTLADRMGAEKEAFGFYFSSHPTDQIRHLADANGARSFAALCALPAPADGGRVNAVMAALIEEARWRTSAKGKRYMMATCSDSSGQFIATCFDDLASAELETAAKTGACALLRVELDWRAGEETPRVTIRTLQGFDTMESIRLRVDVETADAAAIPALAALVADERGGRGEMYLKALLPDGSRAEVLLGRDFRLDAELVARIERLPGLTARIGTSGRPQLHLVGA